MNTAHSTDSSVLSGIQHHHVKREKWLVIHILSQVSSWCEWVVSLSRLVELYQLISTQALSFQTLLWIRLVLLIFTFLTQNAFAPLVPFSLWGMVFHTSQIPKYLWTWQKSTVTALPHVPQPDFTHLLERSEVTSNAWAAESCFAPEGGGCFGCSQGCDSLLRFFFTGCCWRGDKSPYVQRRKNLNASEKNLSQLCNQQW